MYYNQFYKTGHLCLCTHIMVGQLRKRTYIFSDLCTQKVNMNPFQAKLLLVSIYFYQTLVLNILCISLSHIFCRNEQTHRESYAVVYDKYQENSI